MAPVVRALAQTSGIQSAVCTTAQHRQLLDQVMGLFQVKLDFDLDLMREDQSLGELSSALFAKLDPVLAKYQPDWVLVQGDTTTVAIAALVSYYRRVRVGHVEAGLRTFNKWQPFPEEINRRVASACTDLHFAPTAQARDNLLREAIPADAIVVTGNPVIDALRFIASQPEPGEITALLKRLGIGAGKRLILVTAHRRESFGSGLESIFAALGEIAARGDVELVYPVHPNPNVQEPAHRMLGKTAHVTLLPPMEYAPLVHLMKRATLVLTDSGGLQEEAPAFGVPVLVLRDVTERPEGVQAGTLKLVGTDRTCIVTETARLLNSADDHARMSAAVNPFGDGHAAGRIVRALLDFQKH